MLLSIENQAITARVMKMEDEDVVGCTGWFSISSIVPGFWPWQ